MEYIKVALGAFFFFFKSRGKSSALCRKISTRRGREGRIIDEPIGHVTSMTGNRTRERKVSNSRGMTYKEHDVTETINFQATRLPYATSGGRVRNRTPNEHYAILLQKFAHRTPNLCQLVNSKNSTIPFAIDDLIMLDID